MRTRHDLGKRATVVLALAAAWVLSAGAAFAAEPPCSVVPNASLPADSGRITVAFPKGTGTQNVAIFVFGAGGREPLQRGKGSLAAPAAPGTYSVSVNGIFVTGVEVRPMHDTRVRVGVLRVRAPSGAVTEIRRPERQNTVRFRGGGDIGLPIGDFEVSTGDRRELRTVSENRVAEWDVRPADPRAQPGERGEGQLTARDLAPVDAYVDYRQNGQWIVGDTVEVVASREYFATALTVNVPAGGFVQRKDFRTTDEAVVVLTFVGAPSQASVVTNPRVQIGTGTTVSARQSLVVRLQRTKHPDRPVRLRVSAQGDASRGKGDKVLRRAPSIVIGGDLVRRPGGYVWEQL